MALCGLTSVISKEPVHSSSAETLGVATKRLSQSPVQDVCQIPVSWVWLGAGPKQKRAKLELIHRGMQILKLPLLINFKIAFQLIKSPINKANQWIFKPVHFKLPIVTLFIPTYFKQQQIKLGKARKQDSSRTWRPKPSTVLNQPIFKWSYISCWLHIPRLFHIDPQMEPQKVINTISNK